MKAFLRPVPGRRARGPGRAALAALLLLAAGTAAADARRDAASRFGARIDHELRVCLDDPATPAAGARVVWKSDGHGENARAEIEAEAGPDGVVRIRGVSFGYADLVVTAPGAYAVRTHLELDLPEGADAWAVRTPEGAPWLPDGSLRLRSVRAPHAMARSELPRPATLPAAPVGFDAEKGAFLPPLGEGETADFLVEGGFADILRPGRSYAWLVVRPAPGGALAEAPDRGDALRLPREAPAEGWSEEPLRFLSTNGASVSVPGALRQLLSSAEREAPPPSPDDAAAGPPPGGIRDGAAILFRSRVRRGEDGAIASARYGAILPARPGFGGHFAVFFNTTDNERSLEPERLQ